MALNKQQIMTSVGTVLTALGPVLTLTGTVTPDQWAGMSQGVTQAVDAGVTMAGAVMTVVGLVQVWWANRQQAQVQAASNVDGVQVHVAATAPPEIKALVADKTLHDVVPMGPGGPVAK